MGKGEEMGQHGKCWARGGTQRGGTEYKCWEEQELSWYKQGLKCQPRGAGLDREGPRQSLQVFSRRVTIVRHLFQTYRPESFPMFRWAPNTEEIFTNLHPLHPRRPFYMEVRRLEGWSWASSCHCRASLPPRTSKPQPITGFAQVLNYEWRLPDIIANFIAPLPHVDVLREAAAIDFVAFSLQGHYKLGL